MTLIPNRRRRIIEGRQDKGIQRKKSDDQPGKWVRRYPHKSEVMQIPKKGKRFRTPTGPPGSPRGKPITGRKA